MMGRQDEMEEAVHESKGGHGCAGCIQNSRASAVEVPLNHTRQTPV